MYLKKTENFPKVLICSRIFVDIKNYFNKIFKSKPELFNTSIIPIKNFKKMYARCKIA